MKMTSAGLPLVGVSGELRLPPFLEARSSPVSGRGLYAKEEIPRGTQLFTALPLSHVSTVELVCQNCLKKNELQKMSLLRCSACKGTRYCAASCQRSDWSQHRRECAGLRRIAPRRPTDTMRLVLRLLTMAASPAVKEQLDSLMTNEDKMNEESRAKMRMQVMGVVLLLGEAEERGAHDRQDIFRVLGKVMSNGFSVMDSTHEQAVGLAVYGTPSLLNHSCQPNAVVIFNGTKLVLRSVRPIASGDQGGGVALSGGSEKGVNEWGLNQLINPLAPNIRCGSLKAEATHLKLTISYYEVLESRERRREHLRKVYFFNCMCHRCQVETMESSPLHMMYAGKDWTQFVKKSSEFVVRCCASLHNVNLVLTKVREQLMRGQLQLEAWQDALETGVPIADAYRHCLHDCHPVLVLHLVKMGKLRRVLGSTPHLRQALGELGEAERLGRVTFGSDSLMGRVKEMLEDTRTELAARE